MQLRAVTDVEKDFAEGLAPARREPPRSAFELLEVISKRERAVAIALNGALWALAESEETPETVVAWKQMLTAFKTLTGCLWHDHKF